jgi:hypothetical protein
MSEALDFWNDADTVHMLAGCWVATLTIAWYATRTLYRNRVADARDDAGYWCARYHEAVEALPETLEERRTHHAPEAEPRTMRQARRRNQTVQAIEAAAERGVFDDTTVTLPVVRLEPWMLPDPEPLAHMAEPVNWPASLTTAVSALEADPAPGEDTAPFVIPRDLVEA